MITPSKIYAAILKKRISKNFIRYINLIQGKKPSPLDLTKKRSVTIGLSPSKLNLQVIPSPHGFSTYSLNCTTQSNHVIFQLEAFPFLTLTRHDIKCCDFYSNNVRVLKRTLKVLKQNVAELNRYNKQIQQKEDAETLAAIGYEDSYFVLLWKRIVSKLFYATSIASTVLFITYPEEATQVVHNIRNYVSSWF